MLSKREDKDNKLFIIFIVLAVIFGGLMLLWGQFNTAQQVFEIGFLSYRVDEQLANDEDYVFSEEDGAAYADMLARAEEWRNSVNGVAKICHGATEAAIYGEFAESDIDYTVYDQGSDTTVFLLHGYNETADDAAVFAPYWWEKGYNIIIPSLGRTVDDGIKLFTFGVYEQYDIYDIIQAEKLRESKVILHGRGSGAAAALLLAANTEYDCGIDLIVSDSVYASLDGLKIEQLHAQFNLGEFLTGSLLSKAVHKQLGFDISTIEITEAAAANDIPKMFVCGGADTFISKNETFAVYTAATGEKLLLTIDEAANRMAYTESYMGAGEYEAKLDEFVSNNLK